MLIPQPKLGGSLSALLGRKAGAKTLGARRPKTNPVTIRTPKASLPYDPFAPTTEQAMQNEAAQARTRVQGTIRGAYAANPSSDASLRNPFERRAQDDTAIASTLAEALRKNAAAFQQQNQQQLGVVNQASLAAQLGAGGAPVKAANPLQATWFDENAGAGAAGTLKAGGVYSRAQLAGAQDAVSRDHSARASKLADALAGTASVYDTTLSNARSRAASGASNRFQQGLARDSLNLKTVDQNNSTAIALAKAKQTGASAANLAKYRAAQVDLAYKKLAAADTAKGAKTDAATQKTRRAAVDKAYKQYDTATTQTTTKGTAGQTKAGEYVTWADPDDPTATQKVFYQNGQHETPPDPTWVRQGSPEAKYVKTPGGSKTSTLTPAQKTAAINKAVTYLVTVGGVDRATARKLITSYANGSG